MMRVALVIPHFRQAQFLAACLDSALAQARPPDEIIVIDSSPAETSAIMARYQAPRVRHLIQPPSGVAAARNAGLAATACDLVSFLDADNIATPDRIERQVAVFERDRTVTLCHGVIVPIDRDGTRYPDLAAYGSEDVPFDYQLGWMIERNRIAADTVCVRRDEVIALGGFCETPGVREDYDLWLRMAPGGRFRYLEIPLARYRRHDTNLSNNEAYMFEWEAGALRRIGWLQTRAALRLAFPDEEQRLIVEGEVQLRRGEVGRAERHFRALARRPRAGAALFHLAHLAIARDDMDEAWRLLRRALTEDAGNAALYNNLGVVLARIAEPALAIENFSRALALNPLYQDAVDNMRFMQRDLEGLSRRLKVTRRRLRPQLMPMAATA